MVVTVGTRTAPASRNHRYHYNKLPSQRIQVSSRIQNLNLKPNTRRDKIDYDEIPYIKQCTPYYILLGLSLIRSRRRPVSFLAHKGVEPLLSICRGGGCLTLGGTMFQRVRTARGVLFENC